MHKLTVKLSCNNIDDHVSNFPLTLTLSMMLRNAQTPSFDVSNHKVVVLDNSNKNDRV